MLVSTSPYEDPLQIGLKLIVFSDQVDQPTLHAKLQWKKVQKRSGKIINQML